MPLRIDAHGVLADAEVQGAAVLVAREVLGGVLGRHERRLARRSSCCCSRPGRPSRPTAPAAPAASAWSTLPEALRVAMPWRRPGSCGSASVQPVWQGTVAIRSPDSRAALRVGRAQRVELLVPAACADSAQRYRTARAGRAPRRRPGSRAAGRSRGSLRRRDLVGAERRAVHLAGVLLVRRGPADDGAQRDERRPAGLRLGGLERLVERLDVLVVAVGPRQSTCCTCQPYAS